MLIGIDVGTTAVKAAVFDARGTVLRRFADAYPTRRPLPGQVEQDADEWMTLVLRALAEMSEGLPIAAVGLTSQVNTHVFADAAGTALLPAMTWQDARCADDAAAIDRQVAASAKIGWWGAPLPVDASHILARMAHVARVRPAIWQRTRWVMAPKDYCLFHLTGSAVADPMTNFGILDQSLVPIGPLLDLVPGARERLPAIAGFTQGAGVIRDGLPCAGVPMVTGAMDAWAGLLGAGVTRDGQGLYLSGTSEILGIVSRQRHPTPGVIAFAECEGIVLHAGPTQSGGASAAWAARILGLTPAALSDTAAAADLRHVPLFLPHLDGERAPLWDPQARGLFAGLSSATGPAELARAVLEGVAYSARLAVESLAQSAGRGPEVVHHAGGGAASSLWCQIRADVLGVRLRRTAMRDAGVLGAALMAGVGAGRFASIAEATSAVVQYDAGFEPDPGEASRHAARFEAYKLAYAQMKPVQARLDA